MIKNEGYWKHLLLIKNVIYINIHLDFSFNSSQINECYELGRAGTNRSDSDRIDFNYLQCEVSEGS